MRRLFRAIMVLVLCGFFAATVDAQDLDPKDVNVTLEQALSHAQEIAVKEFPDLDDYILYSVKPRVLKGDPDGLFWQVSWQEKIFPHNKMIIIRVYMKNGSVKSERIEKGSQQQQW